MSVQMFHISGSSSICRCLSGNQNLNCFYGSTTYTYKYPNEFNLLLDVNILNTSIHMHFQGKAQKHTVFCSLVWLINLRICLYFINRLWVLFGFHLVQPISWHSRDRFTYKVMNESNLFRNLLWRLSIKSR